MSISDSGRASFSPDDFDPSVDSEELASGVTKEDLEQLKLDAVTCINETLFKKLLDIEQVCHSNIVNYHDICFVMNPLAKHYFFSQQ